jgi:outer membrane protein TolC
MLMKMVLTKLTRESCKSCLILISFFAISSISLAEEKNCPHKLCPDPAGLETHDSPAQSSRKAKLPTSFSGVIRHALSIHPQIANATSRVREAKAGVIVARANYGLQVEGKIGIGDGAVSQTQTPLDDQLFDSDNLWDAIRREATLSGRQLLFDFGSSDASIVRAVKLGNSEEHSLHDKREEIALKVAYAYLQISESRRLTQLNRDNVLALEKILDLVKANQANGNGTIADVKRVEARLVDSRAVSADTEASLQNGMDQFRRLVRAEPAALLPAPSFASFVPKTAEIAVALLPRTNPKLLSIEASEEAARKELQAQKAGTLPKIMLETDLSLKSYSGVRYRNDFDARAMITLSYKFMDGGLADGQSRQITEKIEQEMLRHQFERDELDADIRQFFRAIDAARGKAKSLDEGVAASARARELYTEQFLGGKRTLFELLDIQAAYFNASRSQIMNFFEETRSTYGVLRALGLLTQTALKE